MLGDRAHAELVTEEVFVEIWRTAGQFDPAREGALGWMMGIAHREAVHRIRSAKGEGRREVGAEPEVQPDESCVSHHANRVRTSLDALTPVQRKALELAYFGGHTHAEVAQILGIPLGSAKTRIRNALIHLHESLGPAHA